MPSVFVNVPVPCFQAEGKGSVEVVEKVNYAPSMSIRFGASSLKVHLPLFFLTYANGMKIASEYIISFLVSHSRTPFIKES